MTSDAAEHPDPSAWLAWVRSEPSTTSGGAAPKQVESPGDSRARLAEHLGRCAECQQQVAFLQQLDTASGGGPWEPPPRDVIGSAHGAYVAPPALRGNVRPVTMNWSAPDVRSAPGLALEPAGLLPRVAAGALEQAQISIVATPPSSEGLWRVQGTVWLRDPDPRAIRVLLCVDEHVLTAVETHDGEAFLIEELLPPGWGLEIELPSGVCVELR